MRIDLYTKAVLTVIALLLAAIVFKQYFSPESVALAQSQFAGVQYVYKASINGYEDFFDPHTGEIWTYSAGGLFQKRHLTKLGQPIVTDK